MALPPLPYAEWEPTRTTLHLWAQIVGKMKLASARPKNHWWHAALYLDVHGLTTRLLPPGFEIRFDFAGHRLVVETANDERAFNLVDGLSVAEFDRQLHAALGELDVQILEKPFGLPLTTPFPQDTEHAAYDPEAVGRFWRVLDWSADVFEEFAGWFTGKESPVHLFWHSFDLAVTRFNGRACPPMPDADPVTREAYCEELISFGFWAGDQNLPEPAYYAYAAPEPEGLQELPLAAGARWADLGASRLAILPYDTAREADDPRRAVLDFFDGFYATAADAASWDRAALASNWYPYRG
jgi:Family of unknown function (DUF5996)